MTTLKSIIRFYDSHFEDILSKYDGTIIVMSDNHDIHSFPDIESAYTFGISQYGSGNFMMRECSRKKQNEKYVMTPTLVTI